MFNVRSVWTAVGASFALIALYLVLESGNSSKIIGAGGDFLEQVYSTLQGR